MNKAEYVANEIVRALKVEGRTSLEPEDALIVARAAISILEAIHDKQVRTALSTWQKLNIEHRARAKKWLHGTGDMPNIPNRASQPLPEYLSEAIREDIGLFEAEIGARSISK